MKIVLHTVVLSPHQLPLALEIVRLIGNENFRYVYTEELSADRRALGWKTEDKSGWTLSAASPEAQLWLESADVLLSGIRDFDLFERRTAKGLKTFYMSERWFKPVFFTVWGFDFSLPGRLRLFHPRYRKMVSRIKALVSQGDSFKVFPIGVHASKDMERIGIRPDQMNLWGYFVAPHNPEEADLEKEPFVKYGKLPKDYPAVQPSTDGACRIDGALRLIWVGRMLRLKRVDTIIEAVRRITASSVNVHLLLVGNGPDRKRLETLAHGLPVSFMDFVPPEKIRPLLRLNEVYVFASNGRDGWGAVVSEALEEGLRVIGTYETGAAATILSQSNLFHSGSVDELVSRIVSGGEMDSIGEWTAARAAEKLLQLART